VWLMTKGATEPGKLTGKGGGLTEEEKTGEGMKTRSQEREGSSYRSARV